MALPNNTIEKIKVNNIDHSLIAGYITTGGTTPAYKTWTDIEGLVAQGKVKFVVCNAASNTPKGVTFTPKGGSTAITGTLEANAADLTTFYLVYDNNGTKDQYDEYVSTGTEWEKIGDTGIDLSNYVTKNTYATSAATGNTGQGGEQEATVSGSITYTKAATVTGSAGGATIQGSNFNFTGTAADLTLTQEYQPAGTVSKPNVNLGDATTITYVSGVKSTGGTANAITAAIKDFALSASTTSTDGPQYVESVSGTFNTDAIKGISGTKNVGFSTTTNNVMYGATVTSGVLSWSVANANTQDAHTGTAASTGTVSSTTKYMKHTNTAADSKATVVLSTGLSTATFNNYTSAALASAPTFTGTTVTLSVSTTYTPAGTIGGSQVISGHTHGVGSSSATATYSLKAAVSNHTHSLGNHTHSVDLSGN